MQSQPLTLLCLSHLPWHHVWQRPQQLMTRFATRCRVIYVDPPDFAPHGAPLALMERLGMREVRVIRPEFPGTRLQEGDAEYDGYQRMWLELLPQVLDEAGPNTILWIFSPMADFLVARARERVKLTVYDCMDDLASFRSGTEELRHREARLLQHVDLLFTGGYSMYEARKNLHPRAFCFPSGVGVEHYRSVRDPGTEEAPTIAGLPHPRLGYFGVLDERIDWAMIGDVAAQRPDWHWALVGPFAKVHPHELPQAPNIHYLGQQPYSALPSFLKGFDIATMPFALNEATRFISPTKTLEYLAGGKQVISSSVPDVAAFYKQIVYLADGTEAWIKEVERALDASPEEQAERSARAETMLAQSSWDNITARMWDLMEERLR